MKDALVQRQANELALFDKRQELQAAELKRQQRALGQIEKKELAPVQLALRREHRQAHQKQHARSPAFVLTFGPPGRRAAIDKPAGRHTSEDKRALEERERKEAERPTNRRVNLMDEFTHAASSDDDDDGGGGGSDGSGGPTPPTKRHCPMTKCDLFRKLVTNTETIRLACVVSDGTQ